ncbi:hypothetical protein C0993_005271, partial [Termitomyces sp. T159_Od127]
MVDAVTLSSAAQAIQTASSKAKLTHELEESLEQLKSIAKLLVKFNLLPAPLSLQRLSLLLRRNLLPLYTTFPILGIRYAVAVLATIYDGKMLPTLKNSATNSAANWEAVQASLLSGVLDFLESNPSYETRGIVANSFYPTLRIVFFPRTNPTFRPGPDLLYILCQVLSETVTLHPDNQEQLRNKDVLGGTNLGLILSQSKNILVIEALLELIVKLLPSNRTSTAARNEFVQDVFDVATFERGDVILKILGTTPPTANWDVVFIEIIDLLADTNSAFPQPFKTSNFHVQDFEKDYNVERLYVDHLGFVANIDEGDQIETLHALYASIESLKVTTPRNGRTTVTILFSPPPSIGQVALVTPSGKWATVAFNIAAEDVARFLSTLKLRNVNINPPGKKLSKLEESLHLNFEPSNKNAIASTQDKGRGLARLWDLSNSQSRVGQALPTSPLLPPAVSEVQDGSTLANLFNSPNKGSPTKTSSPYYDSIFGTTDEELTDFSDTELHPIQRRSTRLYRSKQPRSAGKSQLEVVESDNESQIVRQVKSKRKTIVLSDAETDGVNSPQNTPGTTKPSIKLEASSLVEGTLLDDKAALGEEVNQPVLQPKSIAHSPEPPVSLPSRTDERPRPKRKRKTAGDNVPDPDGECPPSKRLRNRPGAAKTPIESKPPPKPVIAKRYVGKRRTSFRNLPSDTGAVSVPSSDSLSKQKGKQSKVSTVQEKGGKNKLSTVQGKGGKNKVSIVQGKGGKKSTGRASDRKKLQTTAEKFVHVSNVAPSESAQIAVEMLSDNAKGLLLDNMAIQNKDNDFSETAQRRSARVAKVSVTMDEGIKMEKHVSVLQKVKPREKIQDEGASEQQILPQKKPQRAPWNDISVKQPSSTVDDSQTTVARPIELLGVFKTASQDAIAQKEVYDILEIQALPAQEAGAQEAVPNVPMSDVEKPVCFEKVKDESQQSKDSPLPKTGTVERKSNLTMESTTLPSPPENILSDQSLASTSTFPSFPEPRQSSSRADRPRVSFAPLASFAAKSTFDTTELEFETSDYSKEKASQFTIEVMKHKASYRFNKIRKDLQAGEKALLQETAQHLEEIYAE